MPENHNLNHLVQHRKHTSILILSSKLETFTVIIVVIIMMLEIRVCIKVRLPLNHQKHGKKCIQVVQKTVLLVC